MKREYFSQIFTDLQRNVPIYLLKEICIWVDMCSSNCVVQGPIVLLLSLRRNNSRQKEQKVTNILESTRNKWKRNHMFCFIGNSLGYSTVPTPCPLTVPLLSQKRIDLGLRCQRLYGAFQKFLHVNQLIFWKADMYLFLLCIMHDLPKAESPLWVRSMSKPL